MVAHKILSLAFALGLSVGATALPAAALLQSGEQAHSLPALLADRLYLAAQEVGQARRIAQGGPGTYLAAYGPAWLRERLHKADCTLRRAQLDTVDPGDLDRIEGFRATLATLCAVSSRQRLSLEPRLLRLEQGIATLAGTIETQTRNAEFEPVPLHRQELGAPKAP